MFLKKEHSSNGVGTIVNLYQEFDDNDRLVKTVGWLVDDGKSGCLHERSVIRGLTTIEKCQEKVLIYLDGITS